MESRADRQFGRRREFGSRGRVLSLQKGLGRLLHRRRPMLTRHTGLCRRQELRAVGPALRCHRCHCAGSSRRRASAGDSERQDVSGLRCGVIAAIAATADGGRHSCQKEDGFIMPRDATCVRELVILTISRRHVRARARNIDNSNIALRRCGQVLSTRVRTWEYHRRYAQQCSVNHTHETRDSFARITGVSSINNNTRWRVLTKKKQ
jgi:hypothetical protein